MRVRFWLMCLILVAVAVVVTYGVEERRHEHSGPAAPVTAPAPLPPADASADGEGQAPERLVIQRDRIRYPTDLPGMIRDSGLLKDLMDLQRLTARSAHGITGKSEEKAAKDVAVLEESDRPEASMSAYYVRLDYPPYRPEPGVNDRPHQDIIMFVDPSDEANAYFGVQNPDRPEQWQLTLLPGYGPWLKKELDIFLGVKRGM